MDKFIVTAQIQIEVDCKDAETALIITNENRPHLNGCCYDSKLGMCNYKIKNYFKIVNCVKERGLKIAKS